MNKAQRTVLVAGLVVAVAMVVYPPWVETKGRYTSQTAYRLLISDAIEHDRYSGTEIIRKLDLQRLFLQILCVGILTAASYVATGGRSDLVEDAESKNDVTPS